MLDDMTWLDWSVMACIVGAYLYIMYKFEEIDRGM